MHIWRVVLVLIVSWIVAALVSPADPLTCLIDGLLIAAVSTGSYFLGYSAARRKHTAGAAGDAGLR